jgi:hypothetical protein
MAKMNYERAASRSRVRKYGSLNEQPRYERNYLKSKKTARSAIIKQENSSLWTDWFFLKQKNHWTRELRLTDNDQPWDKS